MKELVIIGNRIMSYGNAGTFLQLENSVVNIATGKIFDKATIVYCDKVLPSDINTVGYEYHAGVFVPCAPFGVGNGNIAVVCDNDCKAVKDSGVSFDGLKDMLVKVETGSYTGADDNTKSLTFSFPPKAVFISGSPYTSNSNRNFEATGLMIVGTEMSMLFVYGTTSNRTIKSGNDASVTISGNTLTINGTGDYGYVLAGNESGTEYQYIAFG